MSRRYYFIMVILCLLVPNGNIFGSEFDFQLNWHNTTTEMSIPATNTTGSDWFDPECWGAQDNNFGLPARPPDSNVYVCIEPYLPYPIIDGDIRCSRLSIAPWSWTGAPIVTVVINSGDINCGTQIGLADRLSYMSPLWGYAVLNINGGTLYTPGIPNITDWNYPYQVDPNTPWIAGRGLWVGGGESGISDCCGIVNMYDGSMIVPKIRINYGIVNLYGGLLYDTNESSENFFISLSRRLNRINIAGGELRLAGDRRDQIAYYVSSNRIVPYGGRGDLIIDFNGFDTSVTAISTPYSAWNPNPIDGAIDVPLIEVLTWSAGPSTQPPGSGNAHAVYFGTDFTEVNDATTGTPVIFMGWYDACSFTPGLLFMDTNYFWRVDERNGATVWKGNIWMFKTKGPQATDPVPATGTAGLPLPIVVKWNPGNKASGPTAHAVFFGPNETDVADASIANPLGCFKGYVTDPVYRLSNLDFDLAADTDYYWRIDESNGVDVWKGEVWQVTNTNYFVIEDFESYTDNASMQLNWKMGSVDYTPCEPNNSNGVIGFDINNGNGAMQFDYNNSTDEHFSEVRFDANDGNVNGSDWTGGGALPDNDKCRSLAISFIGDVNNDADSVYDRMYVAIEDTTGNFGMILNPDPEAQRAIAWKQWNINFADFGSPPLNMASIKYLYIGFGVRCDSDHYGGNGTVLFDDIRVYQCHCVPDLLKPVGDFTDDCRVDLYDVKIMSQEWLTEGIEANIFPDGIVDFRDFALIAGGWMTEQLWPNP